MSGPSAANSRAHFDIEEGPSKSSAASSRQQQAGQRSKTSALVQKIRRAFVIGYYWAFSWADPHFRSLRDLKITLRCTIACWAALILLLSPHARYLTSTSKIFEGSYLIPLMAFYLPPCDSLSVYVRKTAVACTMMATAWAYSCLVIFIAWVARPGDKRWNNHAQFEADLIAEGHGPMALAQGHIYANIAYVEPQSSAVIIVGLALALGSLAWFRSQFLAGTGHVASTIAVILQFALPLSTAVYFPFPYYMLGLPPLAAFGFASIFNMAAAFLIFPESSNHKFLDQLRATLVPLRKIVSSQTDLLRTSPTSEDWADYTSLNQDHWQLTSNLYSLHGVETLLKTEVSFRRLGPDQTKALLLRAHKASTAASGFLRFHLLLMRHSSVPNESECPTLDDFNLHLTPSQPVSRAASPPTSPVRSRHVSMADNASPDSPAISPASLPFVNVTEYLPRDSDEHHHQHQSISHKRSVSASNPTQPILHHLLDNAPARLPVGVFMCNRYMMLENLMSHPEDTQYLRLLVELLRGHCSDLIKSVDEALNQVTIGLQLLKSSSPIKALQGKARITPETIREANRVHEQISSQLARFKKGRGRALVVPLASAFNRSTVGSKPPARVMFWSLLYQYSMQKTAEQVLELLSMVRDFETDNHKPQLCWPTLSMLFSNDNTSTDVDEEDPNTIRGLRLSRTMRHTSRDPDRLPPKNWLQFAGHLLYRGLSYLNRPSAFFLYKAVILEGLLILPIAMPATSARYYRFRAIWAPVLSTMTVSQHLGETLHGFVFRLLGSLGGALCGYITWEIGARNPYGMAAICFFGFFIGSFLRVFYPEPALVIIALTTYSLVIGYSWQNYAYPSILQVGYGFRLAATRFVLSAAGLAATFIWAFLPPTSTHKATVRRAYARTLTELGYVICDILTHANSQEPHSKVPGFLFKNLAAIRAKLRAALNRKAFIRYELSIRGAWPKEQWVALAETQLELVEWLEQFLEVYNDMSLAYRKALLRRSRLGDPKFVGRILSVMHAMSLSLQLGLPQPALYTPLLEEMGLEDEFESPGTASPRTLNASILGSPDYMLYAVASTSVFCIINRLDRLMFCTKSLVGESFRVEGVGPDSKMDNVPSGQDDLPPLRRRATATGHARQPSDEQDHSSFL